MDDLEKVKFKRLIKGLENCTGDGTSMITLIIPNKKEIHQVNQTLVEEYGAASNIKSRVNRQSVQSAITSCQQKLKLYNKTPPNGLCIFIGTIINGNDRKQISIEIEPPKPVTSYLYKCDSKFHVDYLYDMLKDDKTFGYLIMDGKGYLLATVSGNKKCIIFTESVDLPNKHGRGGQSALRFSRLRESKRANYIRKVSESLVNFFITDDRPSISGLIFGGSADLKTELQKSDLFDPRLNRILLKVIDLAYGGEAGLNEAIVESYEITSTLGLHKEISAIIKYFDLIATNVNRVVFGKNETLDKLEDGVIELLLIDEDSDDLENIIICCQEKGTDIVTISHSTAYGVQFIKGFGGFGGVLRYDIENNYEIDEEDENEWID